MMKMKEQDLRWRLADIWTFLKNSFSAILRGQFLMRLNPGRYFIHILYTFFLFGMVIWFSLMVENTMAKVETNKVQLKELEIEHSQKTYEVVSLTRRSTVTRMLQDMGSEIQEANAPATTVKK